MPGARVTVKLQASAASASGAKNKVPPRDRLIVAAARLFSEKSFDGVSVREICKAAGTSVNMIHHYFGNKDGLRAAIFEQFDTQVYVVPIRLLGTPARSREDLSQRLLMIFETTLEACLAERDVMMVVLREQASLATLAAFQERLVAFLSEAKRAGLVRAELDSEMISGAMLDRIITQAQYAPWIKQNHGIDIEADAAYRTRWSAANVDLYLNGMLAG